MKRAEKEAGRADDFPPTPAGYSYLSGCRLASPARPAGGWAVLADRPPRPPGPDSVPTCCCSEGWLVMESSASPLKLPGNWALETEQRRVMGQRACARGMSPRAWSWARRGSPWKLLVRCSWWLLCFWLWGTLQNSPLTLKGHPFYRQIKSATRRYNLLHDTHYIFLSKKFFLNSIYLIVNPFSCNSTWFFNVDKKS